MVTPSTSLGSMSLVNCSRWKPQATARANAWASVVLPTPGTSSISRCPRASKQTIESRTTSGFPRMVELSDTSNSFSLESVTGAATIIAIVPCRPGEPRDTEQKIASETVVLRAGRWQQAVRAHPLGGFFLFGPVHAFGGYRKTAVIHA